MSFTYVQNLDAESEKNITVDCSLLRISICITGICLLYAFGLIILACRNTQGSKLDILKIRLGVFICSLLFNSVSEKLATRCKQL